MLADVLLIDIASFIALAGKIEPGACLERDDRRLAKHGDAADFADHRFEEIVVALIKQDCRQAGGCLVDRERRQVGILSKLQSLGRAREQLEHGGKIPCFRLLEAV